MARPHKSRRVCNPPKMSGFKPFGIPDRRIESISFSFEEYESIKLVTYDNLPQEDAARQMNISRPTLTRIYNSALVKVAQDFVEGKSITITGGNYELESDWYKCKKCYKLFEGLESHVKCAGCNIFGQDELMKLNNR